MKFILLICAIIGLLLSIANADTAAEPDCESPAQIGTCRGLLPRFYYNNEAKECQSFNYGGCRGNGNNFITKEECEAACKK